MTSTTKKVSLGLRALAAAALVLALSGCMKIDANLTVAGDTVDGTLIFAVNHDFAKTIKTREDDYVAEKAKGGLNSNAKGVRVEKYSDDLYGGEKFIFTGVDIVEVSKGSSSDALRIVHDKAAGKYKVTGVFDFSQTNATEESSRAFQSLDIRISITFPGKVLKHNGALNGTTVTWQPKAGAKTSIEAEAEDAPASALSQAAAAVGGTAVLVALIVGSVLALFLIIWLLTRRRHTPAVGSAAAVAPAAQPPAASPAALPAGSTVEAPAEATVEPTVEAPANATVEPTVETTVEPTVEAPAATPVEPTVEAPAAPAADPTEQPTPPPAPTA